jgi:Fe-S-cluster containining protein
MDKTFKALKKKKPSQLDDLVHDWHDEVFDKIECLECANCCRSLGPRLTSGDIEKLAKALRMKSLDFEKQYLRIDEDKDYVFKQMPCPFLMDDNYCNVYDARPRACREYPHTDRKKFFQLLDITALNAAQCPAVLEITKKIVKHFDTTS